MRKPERFAGFSYKGERHKGTRFGTLWADYETGEGDVTITLEFCDESWLMRADLLQDVIKLLTREYEQALKGMEEEFPVKTND
jgi:hypothetical protein